MCVCVYVCVCVCTCVYTSIYKDLNLEFVTRKKRFIMRMQCKNAIKPYTNVAHIHVHAYMHFTHAERFCVTVRMEQIINACTLRLPHDWMQVQKIVAYIHVFIRQHLL